MVKRFWLPIALCLSPGAFALPPTAYNPSAWMKWQEVPPGLLKRGERIRVHVKVTVSAEGRATDCAPLVPSGSTVFDTLTCSVFMVQGRFRPALDDKKRPVDGIFEFTKTWEARETAIDAGSSKAAGPQPAAGYGDWVSLYDLPKGAMRRDEIVTSRLMLLVSTDGRVKHCTASVSSERPDLDAYACRLFQLRGRYKPARDAVGNPVEAVDWQNVRWQVPENW